MPLYPPVGRSVQNGGTFGAPGYTFTNTLDTGLYSSASGTAGIAAGGNIGLQFDNGSGFRMSVFGHAPAAQQTVTGSKGANAALTSLMTALAAYGIVVDSTT